MASSRREESVGTSGFPTLVSTQGRVVEAARVGRAIVSSVYASEMYLVHGVQNTLECRRLSGPKHSFEGILTVLTIGTRFARFCHNRSLLTGLYC
jgi:hypothetical protein